MHLYMYRMAPAAIGQLSSTRSYFPRTVQHVQQAWHLTAQQQRTSKHSQHPDTCSWSRPAVQCQSMSSAASDPAEPAAPPAAAEEDWLERTRLLVGPDSLARLSHVNVLIVGLGGVGGFAAEFLCRAGVGSMTIVDGDHVDPTNRNRQLLALQSTHFKPKSQVLAARLKDINPNLKLTEVQAFLDPDTAQELVCSQKFSYVVDCIDSIAPKQQLLLAAMSAGVPAVSSMGAGGRLDPSLVKVADISQTYNDPFAANIRKGLRRNGVYTGVTVVFSEELARRSSLALTRQQFKRSYFGTISYIPALFGLHVSAHIVRDVVDRDYQSAQQRAAARLRKKYARLRSSSGSDSSTDNSSGSTGNSSIGAAGTAGASSSGSGSTTGSTASQPDQAGGTMSMHNRNRPTATTAGGSSRPTAGTAGPAHQQKRTFTTFQQLSTPGPGPSTPAAAAWAAAPVSSTAVQNVTAQQQQQQQQQQRTISSSAAGTQTAAPAAPQQQQPKTFLQSSSSGQSSSATKQAGTKGAVPRSSNSSSSSSSSSGAGSSTSSAHASKGKSAGSARQPAVLSRFEQATGTGIGLDGSGI